jgi:hypothetical protein
VPPNIVNKRLNPKTDLVTYVLCRGRLKRQYIISPWWRKGKKCGKEGAIDFYASAPAWLTRIKLRQVQTKDFAQNENINTFSLALIYFFIYFGK